MELYTPYVPIGLPYVPYIYLKKTPSNIFKFKVKAKLSAHIALATYPDSTKPYIEFVIEQFDNDDNHQSFIRTRGTPTSVLAFTNRTTVETYGFLNENEYRGFWITFEDGKYACGREGEVTPFMTWDNPNPYEINYIGVFAYECDGFWNLNDNIQECKTSGKKYTPIEETPMTKGCKMRQQDSL